MTEKEPVVRRFWIFQT